MRILGICNPASGARPERLEQLTRFARAVTGASVQMSVAVTRNVADAEQALFDAQLDLGDILLISGGDGTIQNALSWILHGQKRAAEVGLESAKGSGAAGPPQIALLPAGSTNMTALDINTTRDWQACLDSFLAHIDTSRRCASSFRSLVSVRDGDITRAGFFVGAGAIVRGIEYCNDVLWAGGAARQERTAGLAMARTIWGVLRKQPPFDQVDELMVQANLQNGERIDHAPDAGALLFATSTLERLLVGARPFWGSEESEPLPYVLVERDARLVRNLAGLMGVTGFKRPMASQGFHSHNCAELVLRMSSVYAIDGELFVPQRGVLEMSVSQSLRFLEL